MNKFHINKEGNISKCSAKYKACPFGAPFSSKVAKEKLEDLLLKNK